jgi:hypothetical protein
MHAPRTSFSHSPRSSRLLPWWRIRPRISSCSALRGSLFSNSVYIPHVAMIRSSLTRTEQTHLQTVLSSSCICCHRLCPPFPPSCHSDASRITHHERVHERSNDRNNRFYDHFVPVLLHFVTTLTTKDDRFFRGRCMEALTLIGYRVPLFFFLLLLLLFFSLCFVVVVVVCCCCCCFFLVFCCCLLLSFVVCCCCFSLSLFAMCINFDSERCVLDVPQCYPLCMCFIPSSACVESKLLLLADHRLRGTCMHASNLVYACLHESHVGRKEWNGMERINACMCDCLTVSLCNCIHICVFACCARCAGWPCRNGSRSMPRP